MISKTGLVLCIIIGKIKIKAWGNSKQKNNMSEALMPRIESSDNNKDKKQSSFAEEFFLAQKDFYRHYAGDASIEILPASEAPVDVPTMAIDLEHGKMYVNPVFFEDKAYSLDKANCGVLHESDHFNELKELLGSRGGETIWKKHADKLKSAKRYGILDNCLDDIKINKMVLKKVPVLEKTMENLYRENLFPEKDFTNLPKHIQFSYALAREGNLPEECAVATDVREEIEKLKNKRSKSGVSLVDYAVSPHTPMAMRIKLQEAHFYPIIDKFFEEDVQKKQKEQEQKKEKGEGSGEQNEEKDGGAENKAQDQKGEKDKKQKAKSADKKSAKKESGAENGEPQDPEEYFQKEYAEYDKNNPHAVPIEDVQKAAEKYIESKKSEKSTEEMSKEAYAKAEGVTVAELDEYERFWREIENLKNPETNEFVIEELRALFQKIINERKKKKYVPKYPTEEGEILAFPAEAVAAVKSGDREPKVWETVEQKEKPREMHGDFDVTLVADRSGSMDGVKAIEQRKAAALLLEALKDFCDELEEARKDIEYDLNVRTEAWSFGDEAQVEILKPLSSELTEKQRVHVYKKLADANGNKTYDFMTLEKIRDNISEDDLRKIRAGKLKKIIIVMSDGQSHGVPRVQAVCNDLREKGIVIAGVGITLEGKSIETTYAPDGQVCENPSDLAKVLSDLLKNELKEL